METDTDPCYVSFVSELKREAMELVFPQHSPASCGVRKCDVTRRRSTWTADVSARIKYGHEACQQEKSTVEPSGEK
jgi:hypothetical protein